MVFGVWVPTQRTPLALHCVPFSHRVSRISYLVYLQVSVWHIIWPTQWQSAAAAFAVALHFDGGRFGGADGYGYGYGHFPPLPPLPCIPFPPPALLDKRSHLGNIMHRISWRARHTAKSKSNCLSHCRLSCLLLLVLGTRACCTLHVAVSRVGGRVFFAFCLCLGNRHRNQNIAHSLD